MPLDLKSDIAIRWDDQDPAYVPVLKEGGITAVLSRASEDRFAQACQEAGIQLLPLTAVQFPDLKGLDNSNPQQPLALDYGNWPGISRGPSAQGHDMEVASASRQPWVDSNGFWFAYLRALYPGRPAVLGYEANEKAGLAADRMVPFSTLELALTEAWAFGGNYILSMDARYRKALLAGDAQARTAWLQMGKTAQWLRQHRSLFIQDTFPTITSLVESGDETAEIANLLFRNNGSPALVQADTPLQPDPSQRLALVAVQLRPEKRDARSRLLKHAEAGTVVITDDPSKDAWWRTPRLKLLKSQEDRDFYALGKGQVVAYKEPIADPSEFSLDVIDIITQKRRAVRLWRAATIVAQAKTGPATGSWKARAVLVAVNYGSPLGRETLTRIQGTYTGATLLRPEQDPVSLKVAKRGTTTEVTLPEFRQLSVVLFT